MLKHAKEKFAYVTFQQYKFALYNESKSKNKVGAFKKHNMKSLCLCTFLGPAEVPKPVFQLLSYKRK